MCALYVDKHRPRSLDKLDYHPELTAQLKNLASGSEVPHLLFHGPSGAGKKTRITALLRALFGPGVEKMRLEHKEFTVGAAKKKVMLTTVASNYHIEMNPSDLGNNDKDVVSQVIKEIAQYHPLATGGLGQPAAGMGAGAAGADGGEGAAKAKTFKVVVIMEADRLSRQAQAALRRTMEKYSGSCRLVLCANSPTRVIEPVRSRCLAVRVSAPTDAEVEGVLQAVCRKEQLTLPPAFGAKVAKHAERNLRRALLLLEACRVAQYPFKPEQPVAVADWEQYVGGIAKDVLAEQTPACLLKVRGKLYELLTNCIPADVIIKALEKALSKNLDDTVRHAMAQAAAHYEHRLCQGRKDIYHLEGFVAKFMACYKQFVCEQSQLMAGMDFDDFE